MKYNVSYRKVVREGAVERTYTPTIGVAFGHEKNIEVRLDALPLAQFWKDGVLLLFPVEKEE